MSDRLCIDQNEDGSSGEGDRMTSEEFRRTWTGEGANPAFVIVLEYLEAEEKEVPAELDPPRKGI